MLIIKFGNKDTVSNSQYYIAQAYYQAISDVLFRLVKEYAEFLD